MTFDEIKVMLESTTNDEELKYALCKVLDNPKIDVTEPELKALLRTYKKEILEIKSVNRDYIEGKIKEMPYHTPTTA